MSNDRGAGLTFAVDEVDHLGWKARFEENLDEQVPGHRNIFGRLEDACVSAHECGEHFPRRNREWEIERRDDSRDTDRTAETHGPLVPQLARHGVAEHPASFSRGVECGVD